MCIIQGQYRQTIFTDRCCNNTKLEADANEPHKIIGMSKCLSADNDRTKFGSTSRVMKTNVWLGVSIVQQIALPLSFVTKFVQARFVTRLSLEIGTYREWRKQFLSESVRLFPFVCLSIRLIHVIRSRRKHIYWFNQFTPVYSKDTVWCEEQVIKTQSVSADGKTHRVSFRVVYWLRCPVAVAAKVTLAQWRYQLHQDVCGSSVSTWN